MPGAEHGVVFTGIMPQPSRFEKYITRLGDEYTAFYYEMIDSLLADPSQTVEAVVEHFLLPRNPTGDRGRAEGNDAEYYFS